jgi:hypothetical protein
MKNAIFGALVLIIFLFQGCNSFNKTLNKYGFAELRPPTTLVPPGTIVDVKEDNPMVLGIICTQVASMGTYKPPASKTQDLEFIKKVTKTFGLDAKYLKTIQGKAEYKKVKDIKMTFSNARVIQISGNAVFDHLNERTPGCDSAIVHYQNKDREVTMVEAVLEADVVYDVVYEKEAGLNIAAENKILKGLAAELGVSYNSSGKSKISGKGLFWGIRDDSILVVTKPDADEGVDSGYINESVKSSHKIRLIHSGGVFSKIVENPPLP